jgi:hypothetical protein
MKTYHIVWWNLENLFEEENSSNRPEWLKSYLKRELKGWTQAVLDKKLNQLARVIRLMNDGAGPDLLSVCEVESKHVLQQLIAKLSDLGRNYDIALNDGEDKRGVDVAFIYDKDKFTVQEKFSYRVTKRTPTRDIFQVNFKTAFDRDLVLIGNHWPARIPDTYSSEPYRIIAAETLSYWISRILEIKGKDTALIVLGDFNDSPFDRSFTEYALSTNNRQKVINARSSPWLYNLMAARYGEGLGSVYYSVPFMFDQILVNRGMIKSNAQIKVLPDTAEVNNFDIMSTGSYGQPRRFGKPSSRRTYDPDGFSDHFPVSVKIKEK